MSPDDHSDTLWRECNVKMGRKLKRGNINKARESRKGAGSNKHKRQKVRLSNTRALNETDIFSLRVCILKLYAYTIYPAVFILSLFGNIGEED